MQIQAWNRSAISALTVMLFGLATSATAQNASLNRDDGDLTLSRTQQVLYVELSDGNDYSRSDTYLTIAGTVAIIEKTKVPRVRTQIGLPLCQTFCPTVLIEFKYCEEARIQDCSQLPDRQRISPIDVLRYRDTDYPTEERVIGNIASHGNRRAHQVMDTIASVPGLQSFFSESCLPYEYFVEKVGDDELRLTEYLESMAQLYIKARAILSSRRTDIDCHECVQLRDRLNSILPAPTSTEQVAAALKLENFKSFLHFALFSTQRANNPECQVFRFKNSLAAEHFPHFSGPITSVDTLFLKIDQILSRQKPVILSNLCMARTRDGRCDSHCVVLTGRKRVRHITSGKEIDLIRVHNSWGEGWQRRNSDGWIPADNLKGV